MSVGEVLLSVCMHVYVGEVSLSVCIVCIYLRNL